MFTWLFFFSNFFLQPLHSTDARLCSVPIHVLLDKEDYLSMSAFSNYRFIQLSNLMLHKPYVSPSRHYVIVSNSWYDKERREIKRTGTLCRDNETGSGESWWLESFQDFWIIFHMKPLLNLAISSIFVRINFFIACFKTHHV